MIMRRNDNLNYINSSDGKIQISFSLDVWNNQQQEKPKDENGDPEINTIPIINN